MSRPKPTVLVSSIDDKSGRAEQVLCAGGIYVVTYEGNPINLKVFNTYYDYPAAKYKKTMFPSEAPANNLVKKLNTKYKTDKFGVKYYG